MTASADTIHSARDDLLAVSQHADWLPSFPQQPVDPRPASVLVLFGRLDSIPARTDELTVAADLDVLLQRRAATLSSHPRAGVLPRRRTGC